MFEGNARPTRYTVREGDDYKKIAEAHGIWDWWDLVSFNERLDPATGEQASADAVAKAQAPEGYRNPDLLAPGDVLWLPPDDDEQVGRALLAEELGFEPPDEAFGGRSYLSPWGTFSFTLDAGWAQPEHRFSPGTKFQFRHVDGEPLEFFDRSDEKWKDTGEIDAFGGFEVDLPRVPLFLVVEVGEAWIEVAPLDAARLRELRLQVPLPSSWSAANRQLAVECGTDALFPPLVGDLDPLRSAFPGLQAGGEA